MPFLKDVSASAVMAGLITVLIGFTSSGIIVFQAASSLGATSREIGSWMWALGLGIGLTSLVLSLRYRTPIATAWSTAGAAMIITSSSGLSMAEAVGAFLISGLLIALCGFTGWFERIFKKLPVSIASGMLAGIVIRFGIDIFLAMKTQFAMVFSMFCIYIAARRFFPRFAILASLLIGTGVAELQGLLHFEGIYLKLAEPTFIMPQFTAHAFIGLAIPLFIITMASQNMPGVAVIRSSGYSVPISPLIGWTGIGTVVLATFGAFAINLAAVASAISMGREAHNDPEKRYVSTVTSGVCSIIIGLFGATVSTLFAAFPKEMVLAIAGLALLGTIGNALEAALKEEHEREPALITFLVTASGFTVLEIGAAFWGLFAGIASLLIIRLHQAIIKI